MKQYEIRADYDRDTIVVYQAYRKEIALPAIRDKKFSSPPFSYTRMTWIKPSFLWMMERSGYGRKSGQEYILAIRIKRSAWEKALSQAVLTHPQEGVYTSGEEWKEKMENTTVNVQWDPERNLRGGKLEYRSIQVGISRHLIKEYNEEWIVDIQDYTPLTNKIYDLRMQGGHDKAKELLPKEKVYPVSEEIKRNLGMD
ncbi:DUF4291 domain-containing protein [Bacteroides sp. 224]|uniref:DUF4291 domain-containing protein n=1 Tax=Bacteroides sp. 224 TaxID=2302936 RepID=UPI0013D403E4|nr:DUF4291 domain-containing protein [Bacteroides sp. 224]NDV67033.1 DUF4291 domain-containing protein [Bacteroides sp. 224]